jgi:16S rRNA (cytosine967-C5)-methyltransferase
MPKEGSRCRTPARSAPRRRDPEQRASVSRACAVPGGRRTSLGVADVTDRARSRIRRGCALVRSNLQRLRVAADVRAADCCEPIPGGTGSHTIEFSPTCLACVRRRAPPSDIKWLSRVGHHRVRDTPGTRPRCAWRLLTPGGKLLYATCSVFPEENDAAVDAFRAHADCAAGWLPGLARVLFSPDARARRVLLCAPEKNA